MVNLHYSTWPVARQLKTNLIFFSMIVCASLILITRYQLQWLRDEMSSQYSKILTEKITDQMKLTINEEAQYIEQELNNFIFFVARLHDINRLVLGFTDIGIISSIPVDNSVYTIGYSDYTTGCFMSSIVELPKEALELMQRDAGMDKVYPLIYLPNYLSIYAGFELGQILHYYPGQNMDNPNYTPIVREWYYTAKDNQGNIIITEPYIDAISGVSIITLSKAILDRENQFFGVAAVDITLEEMTSRTVGMRILERGFTMLISKGGMVLTLPKIWNITLEEPLRIFDENITGINDEMWKYITKAEDLSPFEFTRYSTTYLSMKISIQPFNNSCNISHYLMICTDKDEITEPIQKFDTDFLESYYLIFTIVIVISSIVFGFISVLLHLLLNSLSRKLKSIKKIFSRISHRALLPNIVSNFNFIALDENKKGIESLAKAVKIKISKIIKNEENFSYFQWKNTRPSENFHYTFWLRKLYPFNLYNNKPMPWRISLSMIQKDGIAHS